MFTQESGCDYREQTQELVEELAPAIREKLRALKEPLALQVFVTPTCPYCPNAVVTAFKFAMESPLDMILSAALTPPAAS